MYDSTDNSKEVCVEGYKWYDWNSQRWDRDTRGYKIEVSEARRIKGKFDGDGM